LPFVIQYNKRDLPNAAPVADLRQRSIRAGSQRILRSARITPDPYPRGQNLVRQMSSGEWVGAGAVFRERWQSRATASSTHSKRSASWCSRRSPDRYFAVNLPNAITVGRIMVAPLIAALPFMTSTVARLAGFVIYIIAATSDYFDGMLARHRNLVTDLGRLLDPLADKLLLFATLIPMYILMSPVNDRFAPSSASLESAHAFPFLNAWGQSRFRVGLLRSSSHASCS
jgi:hypothetical protein